MARLLLCASVMATACGGPPPQATVPPPPEATTAVTGTSSPVIPPPSPPPANEEAPSADEYGPFKPWPPRVIATPKIPLTVDVAPLLRAGCTEKGGRFDCTKVPGFPAEACSRDAVHEDALGGLTPKLPVLECWGPPIGGRGIYYSRGMIAAARTLIVLEKGRLSLIGDAAEFTRRFAPVTTPEAALGFAVAFTDGHPVFEPVVPSKEMRIYTDTIEGTKVVPDGDGYRVNLFSSRVFGCGLHPQLVTLVRVARNGTVTVGDSRPLYADPSYKACVD